MPRSSVATSIRRGVWLALSATGPLLAGCGGHTESSSPGSVTSSACGVSSTTPNGDCGQQTFAFHGTIASCQADPYGALTPAQCAEVCPIFDGSPAGTCNVDWGGTAETISCYYPSTGGPSCSYNGRRPNGLRLPSRPRNGGADGWLLAQMAHLEAASVHAFVALGRDLARHGAPARLCAASRRAARDEVRHAKVMREFAERAGACVAPVRIARRRRPTVLAMAIENAVEGCVGETYGAAVAHVQSRRAGNARLRARMKHIAADETRHAELSFELAGWFDSVLSAADRRLVRDAQRRAAVALARTVRRLRPSVAAEALGLPTPSQAWALVEELRRSLWEPENDRPRGRAAQGPLPLIRRRSRPRSRTRASLAATG